MTAALFILYALSSSDPPGYVQIGGGVHGLFPMATVGGGARVADGVAVEGRYDLVAGLAHDLGLGLRVALPAAWDVSLYVAHGFFGEEELQGIYLAEAPLGNGLTTTAAARWTQVTTRGARVGYEGGLTARWVVPEETFGTIERAFDPTLHHLHAGVEVAWPGGAFLRVRALVPVQADLRVLGYLPLVAAGHTWSLE